MGIIVVEICNGSLIMEVDIENLLETEFPEVAVLQSDCLSFCGMCARNPYAIVNGKRIFAKTIPECLELIREHVKNELAVYS